MEKERVSFQKEGAPLLFSCQGKFLHLAKLNEVECYTQRKKKKKKNKTRK